MNAAPLSHKTILITRPRDQAAHLAGLIRQAGGEALIFPAIEILDPLDTEKLDAQIDQLDDYDLAIFISPTAAVRAMERIARRRSLPPTLQIAAIGQGSARELRQRGANRVIAPGKRSDSEALLELPELQHMHGKRVLIFRGAGGRELLANSLGQRGAIVEYAECYRRACPDSSAAELLRRGLDNPIHGIVVTSSEGLRNLCSLLGESGVAWLSSIPVFVPHPNIEQAGRKLGLTRLIVAEGGDEAVLQGMIETLSKST